MPTSVPATTSGPRACSRAIPTPAQARWFYQFSPHDLYDYDAVNESLLLDLPVSGAQRKVIVRPERNGFIYVIDRATGQVLSADPFGYDQLDPAHRPEDRRPIYNPDKQPRTGPHHPRQSVRPRPARRTGILRRSRRARGLVYIPHINLCMDCRAVRGELHRRHALRRRRAAHVCRSRRQSRRAARPGIRCGGARHGKIKEDLPLWSGALATAGDLVFYGTMDGWFKAVDARSGALKWQFKTGSGIIGQPVSYRGPDGRQYVAVLSGVGGWAGAIVVGKLDPARHHRRRRLRQCDA